MNSGAEEAAFATAHQEIPIASTTRYFRKNSFPRWHRCLPSMCLEWHARRLWLTSDRPSLT
jgi:hypothetical protein